MNHLNNLMVLKLNYSVLIYEHEEFVRLRVSETEERHQRQFRAE